MFKDIVFWNYGIDLAIFYRDTNDAYTEPMM